MPSVRKEDVIAILLADIHLSLTPPIWRSNEPDWLEAQRKVLDELDTIQQVCKCPILCAGDIFNWWDSKPELINFAMEYLLKMFTIPGQHDLPRHRYEDIKKSAYWTLAKAGKIKDVKPFRHKSFSIPLNDFVIYGFPFGEELTALVSPNDNKTHIALVHDYIWIPGYSYPNAPEEKLIQNQKLHNKIYNGKYFGYDIVVYGDNHKNFQRKIGTTTIFNCGTLMRRASDEENYKPQVGLLLKDGSVVPHYLDISQDKHLTKAEEKTKAKELDIKAFFSELEKLGDSILDFKKAILRATNDKQVKKILIEAMEKKQKRDE